MNAQVVLGMVIVLAMNLNVIGCTLERYKPVLSSAVMSGSMTENEQDYRVRGEIRQTYQLSPNANVEVTGIEGSVEVETTDGNTVEIHFVRYARTQADYDCETIGIKDSPSELVVQHQTSAAQQCRTIQAREELKLIVPHSANLSFKRIEGDLTVGRTDGFLRLDNIEGSVRASKVQAARITSVERGVSLNIAQLSSQGISVRNVEGNVELGVANNLNAVLRVGGVSLNVEADLPNAQVGELGRKGFQLQLGTGGAAISIFGIEGSVKIRRI